MPKMDKPSLLLLQEDAIRADRRLRGQPHWLDENDAQKVYETYLIELKASKSPVQQMDERQLARMGVTVQPRSVFRYALKAMKKEKTLQEVRKNRGLALRAVFRAKGFTSKFFLLRVVFLLRQAELMGALALWLNTRVFLTGEPQSTFADAIQLVAPGLNITTVAYQYSNLHLVSPLMMSTADKLLIFSEMYKKLYQVDGISPDEFVVTGYPYDGVSKYLIKRANEHRKSLKQAGAKFIVCYFDENVQSKRWLFPKKNDHLKQLHTLVRAVLKEKSFGLVVKSQFICNYPSKLYPNDELIREAKLTGRYLELKEGTHRNDIYPTEAALVSDFCIGHKFGATAALEAAIVGVRTVLLDEYGIKTNWDDVYDKVPITFESIDSILKAIARYRNGNENEQSLGDWRPILHYFDPFRDGQSAKRLRNVLEEIIIGIPRKNSAADILTI